MSDINKELAVLLGLCWHEQVDRNTMECKHCHESMLFPWQRNPDFTADSGKIELLRLMKTRECLKEFLMYLCDVGTLSYTDYLLDTTGLLAQAAVEWLRKEADHATMQEKEKHHAWEHAHMQALRNECFKIVEALATDENWGCGDDDLVAAPSRALERIAALTARIKVLEGALEKTQQTKTSCD
jgi:site-specific recombinase